MVPSSLAADGLRKAVERAKTVPSLDKVLRSLDAVEEATKDRDEVCEELRLPYSSDPYVIVEQWK